MIVALLQLNTTVGDFRGNLRKVLAAARRARGSGARLAVCSELALTGYPPLDLLDNVDFRRQAEEALEALREESARLDMALLTGSVVPASGDTPGKPLANAACLLQGGRISAMHRKVLLPTYDVFDESRYFQPGDGLTRCRVGNTDMLLSVCEDVWNDKTFWRTRRYPKDPVEEGMAAGALPLVNIAASPYSQGKGELRSQMLRSIAARYRVPVIYVNQVGGNDSLIFDGRSMVVGPDGTVAAQAAAFSEDTLLVELEGLVPGVAAEQAEEELQLIRAALVTGLADYARKCGFPSAVLGLSGGIDSALTAALAAEALGPERVLGVLMPSPYTSQESVEDALSLARNLGIGTCTVPISGLFQSYRDALAPCLEGRGEDDHTEENIQARIRGNILMALSNRYGHLLLSTGNKSELAVGYCTLYGDMSGGLSVISDLYKGEVYRLAELINAGGEVIPRRTLERAPTAELRPGQKDQDSLPPYDLLDAVLKAYLEEQRSVADIVAMGYDARLVRQILNRVEGNEYKRQQAAPGLKVSWKAFGLGRRCPIAKAPLF